MKSIDRYGWLVGWSFSLAIIVGVVVSCADENKGTMTAGKPQEAAQGPKVAGEETPQDWVATLPEFESDVPSVEDVAMPGFDPQVIIEKLPQRAQAHALVAFLEIKKQLPTEEELYEISPEAVKDVLDTWSSSLNEALVHWRLVPDKALEMPTMSQEESTQVLCTRRILHKAQAYIKMVNCEGNVEYRLVKDAEFNYYMQDNAEDCRYAPEQKWIATYDPTYSCEACPVSPSWGERELLQIGVGMMLEETQEGVVVSETVKGSPAEMAGIQKGDKIVGVNGAPIIDADQAKVKALIRKHRTQDGPVKLTIARGEETLDVEAEKTKMIITADGQVKMPGTEKVSVAYDRDQTALNITYGPRYDGLTKWTSNLIGSRGYLKVGTEVIKLQSEPSCQKRWATHAKKAEKDYKNVGVTKTTPLYEAEVVPKAKPIGATDEGRRGQRGVAGAPFRGK